ncbi:DNA internalization-related competence protein ComEC/Rec2 [Shewanella canadensis]|uniref:DNA internalization-related competence protein ComEC/Rec2 n=1 Tax=Shewanella canadensis TaxID=271096 RepID=A0A3S0IQ41_9GAMM|nr:DNA internalization-related competence protein ComEC/Rec2 [Shewanella canadensis]RTR39463.1 DNA internalization-related competence protein ComEC/Rec2 [Shewanella canadensis]
MNRFMFGFSAIILSAMLWPSLPPLLSLPAFALSGIILLRRLPIIAGALLAVAWVSIYAQQLLTWEPLNTEQNLIVKGEIISLVSQNSDWLSMDIRLLRSKSSELLSKNLRISWKKAPKIELGELWEFEIKAKPITSVLNQGGYNQQRALLGRHIVGKGSVQEGRRLGVSHSLRAKIITELMPHLKLLDSGDLILALLLGDKSLIDSQRWHSLRVTGSGHLVAISGLHLSVVAAWVFMGAFSLLSYCSPQLGRRNLLLAAMLSAVICSMYAYLAGFALPTQRALVMLLLLLILSMIKRFSSPWERLLAAMFLLLLFDPFCCLSAGFWLSFLALSIILLTISRTPLSISNINTEHSRWQGFKQKLTLFWSIQWRLSLGLGLLQALFFGGMSPYGLLFNFLFVPWFSIVVIPLSILSLVMWGAAMAIGFELSGLFAIVDISLAPMLYAFTIFEQLPSAWFPISDKMIMAFALGLMGLWLITHSIKLKWKLVSLVFLLPALLTLWSRLVPMTHHEWRVHLLDVGQGLCVVIEKAGRAWVYDTGAAYGDNFSYAERVILPFLNSRGISDLDYLVLSHGDNDHAGGADKLIEAYPSVKVVSDLVEFSDINCRPKVFNWYGLNIEVLGPKQARGGNDGSCVLSVSDRYHSLLLPGDIEVRGEWAMLNEGLSLQSEVLIAPHHGSRTSSTQAFIKSVSPELVLFPSGFNNRYGFPKQDVVNRYKVSGSEMLISGKEGQVSVIFKPGEREIKSYRSDLAPFWYNGLFRFGELADPE